MNERIDKTPVNTSSVELNEDISLEDFIRRVLETRGGIFGISKKRASKMIKTVPDHILEQSLPGLATELEVKISEISAMPPAGGMPAMGNAIGISNIRTFIESIEEKLKTA